MASPSCLPNEQQRHTLPYSGCRGVSPYATPGQPQSPMNKATEGENEQIDREIASLSSRSKQRVIPGASHVIQADQPDAVVQAVLDVLAQIK